MFKPITFWMGLRYTRAKRSNHFISFISLTSMLGIALGVAVLITVLSVMNGFDEQIHKRFFGMAPEVTVTSFDTAITDWQPMQKSLRTAPGVKGTAPFVGGEALITANGNNVPIFLSGVIPTQEQKVSTVMQKMIAGTWPSLQAGKFNIVIGKSLANQLGVLIGDKINVMIPKAIISPMGMSPRFKAFTVSGIFSAGVGFGFDDKLAFINLGDAQKLFVMGDAITGLHLKLDNIYAAPQVARQIAGTLPPDFQVNNWTEQFGAFFKAIQMEKTMMFLILLLIIAVAAFNLVSSLVMIVNDKQSDIAILRTFGALPRTILGIFIVQGCVVGLVGTLLGLAGGLSLAYNVTDITNSLQEFFGVQLMSSSVYFIDYLPSKVEMKDVFEVTALAFLMSFIATLYPAWQAARTQPAEALRYD